MIEYNNNTDEFNGIETGQTVYISGLPGKSNSFLNNKHGVIKNILMSVEDRKFTYVAEVILHTDKQIYLVNFDYIFRVGKKFNDTDLMHIIWEDNPFEHYRVKKNIVYMYPMLDDNGQLMAICDDIHHRKHVFLFSGIN